MDYFGVKWIFEFENQDEKISMVFSLNEEDQSYFTHAHICKDDINITLEHIPVTRSPNHVYRSDKIDISGEFVFRSGVVENVRFLLKFRNNLVSPVSTIFVTCKYGADHKTFAMNIENATRYSIAK